MERGAAGAGGGGRTRARGEESEESEAELEVTRTVGWFTTLYPVLLEARAGEWPVAGAEGE